ncbi:MAG: hypothetical protein ABIH08_05015 [Candidatus Omnitrophota bacterium]
MLDARYWMLDNILHYPVSGQNKEICRHDYKNATQIGNVDYVCPLCKELLDPLEWFFINSFEFVEVNAE